MLDEKWTRQADKDLRAISKYLIENWDAELASRFLGDVRDKLDRIRKYPESHPFFSPEKKIRRCILDRYNDLYYQVYDQHIEVLRIFGKRQNPKKLKL